MKQQYQSTADLQELASALLGAIIARCDSMNDHTLTMWLREDPVAGALSTLSAQDIAYVREDMRRLVTSKTYQSGPEHD